MAFEDSPAEHPEDVSEENTPQMAEEEFSQDPDMQALLHLNETQLEQVIDNINNCLDELEKKNDKIVEELTKLLEENRQISSELKEGKFDS